MLEGVWGCSWRSVPVTLGMRLGQVPRALGCSMRLVPGVLGDFFSGSVPGALGMCLSVDTQSFWDAQWGQCL